MKQNGLLNALFVSLVVIMTACEERTVISANPNFRIQQTDITNRRTQTITTYTYRSDGKLDSYAINASPGITGLVIKLKYDAQGRLVGTQTNVVSGYNARRREYEYNAAGLIQAVKQYYDPANNGNFVLELERRFEYDGVNTSPTKISLLFANGRVQQVEKYTYTNGNIVQLTTELPDVNTSSTQTFAYDDKPNPYQSFSAVEFSPAAFSRNNVIDSRLTSNYNDNGLLVSRYNTSGNDPLYKETITYEQY